MDRLQNSKEDIATFGFFLQFWSAWALVWESEYRNATKKGTTILSNGPV
jgi:hypothetical protein